MLDGKKAVPVSYPEIFDRIIDKAAAAKVLEIDLSEFDVSYAEYGVRGFRRAYVPSCNELYIDGKAQTVARYPNEGDIPLTEVIEAGSNFFKEEFDLKPCRFRYDDPRCDSWAEAKDFYIQGIFSWAFADDTLKSAGVDVENKTISTAMPTLPSMIAKPFSRWHAVNLLEEIDCPGEYFVDRETKKVYFYPEGDVSDSLIQLSELEAPMIMMMDAEGVTISGITIENARGTGVYMEFGKNCRVENCVFRNLGMVAVQIGQGATALPEGLHNCHGIQAEGVEPPKSASGIIGSWHEMLYENAAWNNNGGENNGIYGCEIYNTGTGGVLIGGGDRKTLTPSGNYVENCHIYRTNRLDYTYKGGINLMGVGIRIANCKIHDLPGFAVYLHGNDHIIEYNEIYDVITEVSDAGAFYMGRDITEAGNEIRYNFFHDITGCKKGSVGSCAIYFDDGASFNRVHGNFFYNIKQGGVSPHGPMGVIFWGWGSQASVSNNVFIDCPVTIRPNISDTAVMKGHYLGERGEIFLPRTFAPEDDIRGVDIRSDAYREHYPYIYEAVVNDANYGMLLYNNQAPTDMSIFRDAENMDFQIVKTEVFRDSYRLFLTDPIAGHKNEKVHFEIVDFDKIGLKS